MLPLANRVLSATNSRPPSRTNDVALLLSFGIPADARKLKEKARKAAFSVSLMVVDVSRIISHLWIHEMEKQSALRPKGSGEDGREVWERPRVWCAPIVFPITMIDWNSADARERFLMSKARA